MTLLMLGLILGVFSGGAGENVPFSKDSYIDQQYIAYHFDNTITLQSPEWRQGEALSPQERKRRIFHAYFQIQKAKNNDSYNELLERIEEIHKHLLRKEKIENHKMLTWDEFRQEYRKLGVKTLPFLGYGSLTNQDYLERILSNKKKLERVIGFGGQRKFTLNSEGSAILALEEKGTFDLRHLYNGMVFELDESEIEALRANEKQFLIKKVPILKMENIHQKEIKLEYAYTLIYNSSDDKTVEPHIHYLNLVLNCCKEDDPETQDFIRLFAQTTFLGDGATSLEKWLASEVKHYYEKSLAVQPIIQKHLEFI